MKNRYYIFLIQGIFLVLYYLELNKIITIISFFVIIIPIIYYMITDLFSDKNFIVPLISLLTIIILVMHYNKESKVSGERWITESDKTLFVYSKDKKVLPIENNFVIQRFLGKDYIYIYNKDNKVDKKEYNNKIKNEDFEIETIKKENYKTGNYFIEVKNNINGNHREFLVANNGDFTLGSIKARVLNKTDNFKNEYGKALKVGYSYPSNKRNYQHWIFKKYPKFNNELEKDDPLMFTYKGDETKNRYFIKATFFSPTKYIYLIIFMVLLLAISFMRFKNEN